MEDKPPTYFKNSKEFRSWLNKNGEKEKFLWVGYYRKSTQIPSIDWPESVDQALCFGWIDGIRKTVDEKSYKIRFTPRNPNSHWSKVNIEKVKKLKREGLMKPQGLKAFALLKKENTARASFEQKSHALQPEFEKQFRKNKKAWKNFQNHPNWIKNASIHWINSAKKDETKSSRFSTLLECSEKGLSIPMLRRN